MGLVQSLKIKVRNKRITCIDFGGSFIKIACLEVKEGRSFLLGYVLKEFDSTHSSSEEISILLAQVFENNPTFSKEVSLSISDPDRIFIKKLTLPFMSKEELLSAVQWQLKGELPFSVSESTSDLQVIREYTDNEGARKIELFCVFAKKDAIDKYVAAVISCGLIPQTMSTSVFNYCGILEALPYNSSVSAIFDIGHTHSQIAIYQKNRLSFVRNLNFSTAKLVSSLVGSVATDKGRLEINSAQAEQLAQQLGIPLDETAKLDSGIKAGQLIPLMRPLLETAVKELERSFGYFASESGLDNLEMLYITGGGANLKNLDNYLAGQLKLKVQPLPLPESLDVKSIDSQRFTSNVNQLSSAIGLGLSLCGINLLPREIRTQKAELIQKTSLRLAAIAVGAIFVFSWFMINFQIRDYKRRLTIARQHLESVEEVKAIKQTVDLRDDLINRIHSGRVPSGGVLKLVSSIIPASVILNEFDLDQVAHKIELYGVVQSSQDSAEKVLTDFMKRLEDSPFIREANLINSKDEQGINSFQIECILAKE